MALMTDVLIGKKNGYMYRPGKENIEVLRNVYSKVDSYLSLFSNAHSVCLNLHLLLALNTAWNVCAAWQKVWYEEESTE